MLIIPRIECELCHDSAAIFKNCLLQKIYSLNHVCVRMLCVEWHVDVSGIQTPTTVLKTSS